MYNHKQIESKWQKYWLKNKTFKTTNKANKKFYVLDMFPYPSGSGLHVGHPEGYTATDIVARYKRLNGFDVLHPIGWDAFGLPAEQYAIQTGNHPQSFTKKNINKFRKQLQSLGFSFDYDKEINTTDPNYFKTTQWIFLKMYEKGLAEIKEIDVNWCPELATVLANEEVITLDNGTQVSERGSFPVIKKPMKQWVLKITAYADQLFADLDQIAWPTSLKKLQKNWIKNEDGSLHLQDWIFSRQRYWGEPFPIAFDESDNVYLIQDLPVKLPDLEVITPSGNGKSPLANAKDWLVFKKNGKTYRRETNTMPQWAGSCWYYLAYILKQPNGQYWDIESPEAQEAFSKWLPVDLYIGGQEHAVLHLLYARFWHKVLYDLGVVPSKEPFLKVINQGMILGSDGQKMSKSRGNTVNPDSIIFDFGADALRIYEMFMGPLEDTIHWQETGIAKTRKWIARVYRAFTETLIISEKSQLDAEYNLFVRGITLDIESLKFNVAISKMMVFINSVYKKIYLTSDQVQGFLSIFSVFAPHLAEELLNKLDLPEIYKQKWPIFCANKINDDIKTMAIQVNGKLRATMDYEVNQTKTELLNQAKNLKNIQNHLTGKIVKEIYVPNKIINIIVK